MRRSASCCGRTPARRGAGASTAACAITCCAALRVPSRATPSRRRCAATPMAAWTCRTGSRATSPRCAAPRASMPLSMLRGCRSRARRAPRHAPRFAFEYMDGGAGEDTCIRRNWAALDSVELVPRYGITTELPPVDIDLFGRRYAAPIGVAPMGGPSIVWPGADKYLAAAAQKARVPYVLGTVGGATIETAAKIAPDVLWFQLYRMARNDHAIGFDLMARADAAGAHLLLLTAYVPVL